MDTEHQAEAWLYKQFFTLGKTTVRFNTPRTTVDQTEKLVRRWFKTHNMRIFFKKEPKGQQFSITVTKAFYGEH